MAVSIFAITDVKALDTKGGGLDLDAAIIRLGSGGLSLAARDAEDQGAVGLDFGQEKRILRGGTTFKGSARLAIVAVSFAEVDFEPSEGFGRSEGVADAFEGKGDFFAAVVGQGDLLGGMDGREREIAVGNGKAARRGFGRCVGVVRVGFGETNAIVAALGGTERLVVTQVCAEVTFTTTDIRKTLKTVGTFRGCAASGVATALDAGLPCGAVCIGLAVGVGFGVVLFDLLAATATSFMAGLTSGTTFDKFVFGMADFEGAVFGLDIAFTV